MKTVVMIYLAVFLLSFTPSCSADGSTATHTVSDNSAEKIESEKESEFTGDVKFPFDFPRAGTIARKGENVLVPSYDWLVEAIQNGADKTTMIWYAQKMETPGEQLSEVKFMNDVKKVPNAYIIPIPAGGSAKEGDILLTWWQSGSGLQRAIVTSAANPKAPTVRYLDLNYNNPARSRDGKSTIGQMDEQIKPDTFTVIKNEMDPGTSVAIGSEMKHGQVIRVEGDKIFVAMFAGKTGVFPRSEVIAVPIRPDVSTGDKVKAVRFGSFKDGVVSKIDPNIGRVWVRFENAKEDEVIAFGDILPK